MYKELENKVAVVTGGSKGLEQRLLNDSGKKNECSCQL